MANVIRVGMRVRPRPGENITISNGGAIWGWVETVCRVVRVHPFVQVLKPADTCPSGWRLSNRDSRYRAEEDAIIVDVATEDMGRLEEAT